MSTIVVTGAGGFIGRACVARFAAEGCDVRGLVRALSPDTAARPQFLPVGDLTKLSSDALRNVLRGARVVVHLAAQAHQPLDASEESLAALRRVNVDATERLARAAAQGGARHFVFASSVKVHGETSPPGRPLRESDPPNPPDEYAASKWAAERALAAVAEDIGLRITALRLPLTYGPGAKGNFAALARALSSGVPLPLAGIHNRRSVLGTGNLGSALAALLASDDAADGGQMVPYFLADAEPVSTPDLVRAMARALRVSPRIWTLPRGVLRFGGAWLGRSEMVERLLDTLEVDTAAFQVRFDWTPPCSLDDGLAAAFAPL